MKNLHIHSYLCESRVADFENTNFRNCEDKCKKLREPHFCPFSRKCILFCTIFPQKIVQYKFFCRFLPRKLPYKFFKKCFRSKNYPEKILCRFALGKLLTQHLLAVFTRKIVHKFFSCSSLEKLTRKEILSSSSLGKLPTKHFFFVSSPISTRKKFFPRFFFRKIALKNILFQLFYRKLLRTKFAPRFLPQNCQDRIIFARFLSKKWQTKKLVFVLSPKIVQKKFSLVFSQKIMTKKILFSVLQKIAQNKYFSSFSV